MATVSKAQYYSLHTATHSDIIARSQKDAEHPHAIKMHIPSAVKGGKPREVTAYVSFHDYLKYTTERGHTLTGSIIGKSGSVVTAVVPSGPTVVPNAKPAITPRSVREVKLKRRPDWYHRATMGKHLKAYSKPKASDLRKVLSGLTPPAGKSVSAAPQKVATVAAKAVATPAPTPMTPPPAAAKVATPAPAPRDTPAPRGPVATAPAAARPAVAPAPVIVTAPVIVSSAEVPLMRPMAARDRFNTIDQQVLRTPIRLFLSSHATADTKVAVNYTLDQHGMPIISDLVVTPALSGPGARAQFLARLQTELTKYFADTYAKEDAQPPRAGSLRSAVATLRAANDAGEVKRTITSSLKLQ